MFHDDRNPLEPEYTQVNPVREERYSGFYETGNIRPPKNRSGALAAVLLACIFCGGLLGSVLISVNQAGARDTLPQSLEGSVVHLPVDTGETRATEPQAAANRTGGTTLLISDTPEAIPNVPQEGGLSLQEIYRAVSPSVVGVEASVSSGTSYGSGVIMSQSGYVITNASVLSGAYSVRVTVYTGREYEARVVGSDEYTDLAVLYIEAKGLTAAEFGDSGQVQVGDAVAVMGDLAGTTLQGGSMTDGIIAAVNENVNYRGTKMTLLQTTASLADGCTGGPVVNCYGQVVGISSARMSDDCTGQSRAIAIPINTAKEVVDQLLSLGYVPGRPDLGVETTVLDYQYQLFYGLPDGLYVTRVKRGSGAQAAGVQAGDVIMYVNDLPVCAQEDLLEALSGFAPGDQVSVVIYRASAKQNFTGMITLQEAGTGES